MLSGDQWTTLLTADPGDWSLADMRRVLAGLGWSIDPGVTSTDIIRPRSYNSLVVASDGPAAVTVGLQGGDTQGPWFGECVEIKIADSYSRDEVNAVMVTMIDRVATVLGPPTTVGGPDARASWFRPETIVMVSRYRTSRPGGAGRVSLSILPRGATQSLEFQNAKYGQVVDPEHWQFVPTGQQQKLADRVGYSRRAARSFARLEENLWEVFSSIADDIGVFRAYLPDIQWAIATTDQTRFVQGSFEGSACYVETHEEALAKAQNDGQLFGLSIDAPFDRSAGKRIADVAITAIRSWGVDDPSHLMAAAWCGESFGRLEKFGLGLAPESTGYSDDEDDPDDPDDEYY